MNRNTEWTVADGDPLDDRAFLRVDYHQLFGFGGGHIGPAAVGRQSDAGRLAGNRNLGGDFQGGQIDKCNLFGELTSHQSLVLGRLDKRMRWRQDGKKSEDESGGQHGHRPFSTCLLCTECH